MNLRLAKTYSKGFTIIEMLVTMAIIVVLIGSVSLNFNRGRDEKDIRAAAEIIANLVLEARADAMMPSSKDRNIALVQINFENCGSLNPPTNPSNPPRIEFHYHDSANNDIRPPESKAIEFSKSVRIRQGNNDMSHPGTYCSMQLIANNQNTLGNILNNNNPAMIVYDKDSRISYLVTFNRITGISTIVKQ